MLLRPAGVEVAVAKHEPRAVRRQAPLTRVAVVRFRMKDIRRHLHRLAAGFAVPDSEVMAVIFEGLDQQPRGSSGKSHDTKLVPPFLVPEIEGQRIQHLPRIGIPQGQPPWAGFSVHAGSNDLRAIRGKSQIIAHRAAFQRARLLAGFRIPNHDRRVAARRSQLLAICGNGKSRGPPDGGPLNLLLRLRHPFVAKRVADFTRSAVPDLDPAIMPTRGHPLTVR